MRLVNWLTELVTIAGVARKQRRNRIRRDSVLSASNAPELLEDRSLLTPTVTLGDPNSALFTRPGGNDSTWIYDTGTTPADGSVNRYPVTAVAYYDVNLFGWHLTRGSIEYATSTAGPWTTLVNDPNNPQYQSVSGKVFRFVDTTPSDTTTFNNVGVGWQLGGGAPGGNVGSSTQIYPDLAPTNITSDRAVILDDSIQGEVLATLTPTDTGNTRLGRWEIDSQSVADLFTLDYDNTVGNTAKLKLGTGTIPAVGQTVTVTARYYDIFQTDSSNQPISGQGFSKTLTYTVIANDTNSLNTFGNDVVANTYTTNQQTNPAIATLSNGNYVVVWQSAGQDKTGASLNGVYGQIFSATGAAVGSEFLIANNSTTSDQISPAVTALNSGRFAVAYSTKAGSNYNVGVRIVEANGTVGSEITANDATSHDLSPTSITTLADGSFAVAWGDASSYDLNVQKFAAADGAKIGGNVLIVAADAYLNSISALSNGSYVVAWISNTTSNATFSIDGGAPVDTGIVAGLYATPPRIAATSGNFILVTDGPSSGPAYYLITGAKYSNAGVIQGSSFTINSNSSSDQFEPAIATLSDGGFVVTWASGSVDQIYNGIAGRRFDSSGTAVDTSEFQINEFTRGDQTFPVVTALTDSGFATAWIAAPDSSGSTAIDVVTRVFNTTSSTANVNLSVSATSGTESGETQITVTATADSAVSGDQTVDLAVTGTHITTGDYGLTDGDTGTAGIQIKIASGKTTGTVTFTISNDTLLEGAETATLTISNPSSGLALGKTTTQTIDITDDESATLDTESTSTATEAGGAQAVGKVTLSITGSGTGTFALGTGISLTADITDAGTGSATSGTDYSSFGTQTVTFNNGATTGTTQSASMTVTDDSDVEGSETVDLTLSNLGGSPVSVSLGATANTTTITDNDFPVPTVSIKLSTTTLKVGSTSNVTFTFNTPVTGFTKDDVTVANGVLSVVSSSDGGTTWSGVLTPNSNIEDATNVLTVDKTGVFNGSMVAGSGTTNSSNYKIDTKRPTATITLSDTALNIGETASVTITFSEAVAGFTNADLLIDNAKLSSVSSADGGITWTATLTPTASVEDASNLITLDNTGISDAFGNAGSGSTESDNYAIDTKRPTVSIDVADTALRSGETSVVTFTFSEAVTGFTIADLLADNSTLSALSSSDGGVTWTATLTPSSNTESATNLVTLDNTGVTDLAGNFGSGLTDSNNFSIDTKVPTADITDISPDPRTTNAGVVSITFSEDVTGVDIADFTLTRDKNAVDISGLSVSGSGSAYTLDLSTVSKAVGNYVLTLNATGSSIVDGASNDLAGDASDSWDRVAPTVDLSVDSTSINEGKTATVTATLSSATDDDVTVNVTIGGTASSKTDYTLGTTPLTITAGQTTATLTIDASDDTLDEADETVTVALDSLTNATAGTNNSLSVTIVDTDSAPITAVATGGVLVITVIQAVPTDTRVTFNSGTSQFVVGSYTDGVLATTFQIDAADVTGGLSAVLGSEADSFDASGISLTTTIQAGDGDDTITGSTGADSVDGGNGADHMTLLGGNDTANGGAGNDSIRGGGGSDVLAGNDGDDSLYGQGAVDTLDGGAGVDLLDGSTSQTAIIDDFSGTVVITNTGYSNASGTIIASSISYITLTGSAGADTVDLTAYTSGLAEIHSGDGEDTLTGGTVKDFLFGDGGNDLINGNGGDDNMQGGLGVDTINGGDGADTIAGGGGADIINGDDGDDRLRGNSGNDVMNGGAGNDSLYGTEGDDQLTGGAGNDRLDGEAGVDRQVEQADADFTVSGTSVTSTATGTDIGKNLELIVLQGGVGANKLDARFATISVNLLGDAGNDTLLGGIANDTIRGAAGNDVMSGGGGDDNIAGGAGTDVLTERLNVDATITGVTITASGLGTDTIATVEGIVLVGLGAANTFNASASTVAVTLLGGNGNDTLIGSSKADVLIGGNRADSTAGIDSLTGGAGVDILDNDPNDVHVGTGDSVVADVFATLPSWIDAL